MLEIGWQVLPRVTIVQRNVEPDGVVYMIVRSLVRVPALVERLLADMEEVGTGLFGVVALHNGCGSGNSTHLSLG